MIQDSGRVIVKSSLLKRAKLIFIEYIICSLSVLLLFGPFILRGEVTLLIYVLCWFVAHLGPLYIVGLALFGEQTAAVAPWSTPLLMACMVWGGITVLLAAAILAYLIRPNVVTGIISFLGIATWFFMGVAGILMGI